MLHGTQGYNSGMGVIFRLAAEINPLFSNDTAPTTEASSSMAAGSGSMAAGHEHQNSAHEHEQEHVSPSPEPSSPDEDHDGGHEHNGHGNHLVVAMVVAGAVATLLLVVCVLVACWSPKPASTPNRSDKVRENESMQVVSVVPPTDQVVPADQ